MKAWLSRADAFSLGAIALVSIVTAVIYPDLPPIIATHFSARGVANGFMPREWGAWIVPAMAIASWLVGRVAVVFFPRETRDRLEASPLDVALSLVVALLVGIQLVVLHVARSGPVNVGAALGIGLGAFLAAFSFTLPRLRRNPLIGIRTPWTLASDENWARTHRFASYTFLGGGVLSVVCGLAGAFELSIAAVLLAGLAPIVESYRLSRERV